MTTLAAIAGSLRRGSVNRLLPRCRPASTRLTDRGHAGRPAAAAALGDELAAYVR